MIFLKDVLEQMEQTDKKGRLIPFKIEFVTADRNKKTGGEVLTFEKITLLKKFKSNTDSQRDKTKQDSIRTPNHWANSTRNIQFPNGQKRKIHIRLITKFNNQPVVY